MEDDRVEKNADETAVNSASAMKILSVAIVVLIAWLAFAPEKVNPSKPSSTPPAKTEASATVPPVIEEPPAAPVVSKKEYVASTQKIGRKGSAIYYKEFLKNPNKFTGERVNIYGKVMAIEEADNQTVIQLQITENFDTVIVHYPETVKVYQDDWVTAYGEGKGTVDGSNRMGAAMTWPVIEAKYIVKRAAAE